MSVERLMNDSPCQYCNKNRQEDNSYPWIMPCYNCPDRSEWITKQLICLSLIKDILGDDYDLSRLRELVEADRDGRCVVLPVMGYTDKDGEQALNSAMNTCFYHNNPVTRYIADAVAEKLTREAAEEALKGES